MAHRGRLNVLTNIAGKTYGQIFREFEGTAGPAHGAGLRRREVPPRHRGHLHRRRTAKTIPVYLAANPSHLEAVDGVLEGIVRAKQDRRPIGSFTVLPILVHGDAAFSGQGVVVETLQMSQLRGYRTGGTIHVVVNNQVGFTTPPAEAHTSTYSTDVAKTIQAPIFHVNGDDPEAVVRVAQLAFAYRQRFHRDVVIDLVCYRRRGHNEGDDPSMTQPLMYNLIEAKRSVRTPLHRGPGRPRRHHRRRSTSRRSATSRTASSARSPRRTPPQTGSMPIVVQDGKPVADLERPESQQDDRVGVPETTGVDEAVVQLIGDAHANTPEGFTVHAKLQALLDKRVEMSRNGGIDWGFGELLAFGSLLSRARRCAWPARTPAAAPSCSATRCCTTAQNGQEWLPLHNLAENQARFWVYDSLLSEYAALAFEYGYSVERADALVLWEAQFGDFANGAQTVLDEFISSRRAEVGPALERRAAAAARLRGPGPGPLVGAHRALPAAVRARTT